MTDDIKFYLDNLAWPKHSPHLAARIMDEALPVFGFGFGFALPGRGARYTFAAGTLACLLAGYLITPLLLTGGHGYSLYPHTQNLLYPYTY